MYRWRNWHDKQQVNFYPDPSWTYELRLQKENQSILQITYKKMLLTETLRGYKLLNLYIYFTSLNFKKYFKITIVLVEIRIIWIPKF